MLTIVKLCYHQLFANVRPTSSFLCRPYLFVVSFLTTYVMRDQAPTQYSLHRNLKRGMTLLHLLEGGNNVDSPPSDLACMTAITSH